MKTFYDLPVRPPKSYPMPISLCVGMGADIANHRYIILGTVLSYLSK